MKKGDMRRKDHWRNGFTLVELLTVVVILTILVVLLFTAGQPILRAVKGAKCLANLRSYGTAVQFFAADNEGLPWWNGAGSGSQGGGSTYPNFESWTRPYLNGDFQKRPRCPLMKPSDLIQNNRFNYAGNSSLCITYPKLIGLPVGTSRVVLAMECYAYEGFNNRVHLNMTMWGNSESAASASDLGSFEEADGPRGLQYHGTRKTPGLNMMFLDGHVALVTPEKADWRNSPTYGTAGNGGYFYDKSQFEKMKAGTLPQ